MSALASIRAVIVTSTRRFDGALRTASTFAVHHPQVPLLVAVVDDRYRQCTPDSENVLLADVRVIVTERFDHGEFDRLVALFGPDELVDLLRPLLVRHLLMAGPGLTDREIPAAGGQVIVLSLPDDAEVVAPLSDLAMLAGGVGRSGSGFAASVIRRTSPPRDGRIPDEVDLATNGFIDRELFAVTDAGTAVLDWWIEQSRRHPLVEASRIRTDRIPWLDQAKRIFPDLVVEVAGLTRSYLNADESNAGSAAVLRFPEFDPSCPWVASPRGGLWPRVVISAHMVLRIAAKTRSAALLQGHNAATLSSRPHSTAESPFAHLAHGYRYDTTMRALYSEALHTAERNDTPRPPNPFGDPEGFLVWLRETGGEGMSRYLQRARSVNDDLAASFAHDDGALMEWARTAGPERGFSPSLTGVLPYLPVHDRLDEGVGNRIVAEITADHTGYVRPERITLTPGINLVGLFKAEMGVGEAARLTHQAVQRSMVPHSLVLDDGTAHRQHYPFEPAATTGFRHDVNVVVANADALPFVVARIDQSVGDLRSVFGDLPTIGLWFWETETFPDKYREAFRHVDEVWAASHHAARAIAPLAADHGVPVKVIPLGAAGPGPRLDTDEVTARAAALGIPAGRFCFLFSFDHRSVAERKNPWGLVDAFTRAFPLPSASGPVLVIKSISGDVDLLGRERLRWMASLRPDVLLIEGFLDLSDRQALVARSDVYISLHRAEGWGLTMAEAMAQGIPTIATGYSGNLEFMNDQNSWLVDFDMVPIARDVAHYGGIGAWAEPDVGHAAELMQRVMSEPDERERRANQALADLRAMAAGDAGGRFVIERLRTIRRVDVGARRANIRAKLHLEQDLE